MHATTNRPRLHAAPLIVSTVALLVAAIGIGFTLRARLDLAATSARLAAAEQQAASLRQQLSIVTTSSAALDRRQATLESRINGRPDPAAIAENTRGSVFTVVTEDGSGSGFVVSAARGASQLVTNFHVVAATYVNGGRTVRVKDVRVIQ
jgi:hypothetical protein